MTAPAGEGAVSAAVPNSVVAAGAGGDAAASLVQQKLDSAKDRFYAKAREAYRTRQISARGVFATADGGTAGSVGGANMGVAAGAAGDRRHHHHHHLHHQQQQQQDADGAFTGTAFGAGAEMAPHERRSAVVRSVIASSSVFNVDSSYNSCGGGGGDTLLTFAGVAGRATSLSVFGGDAEPMMQHIERVRETALLAALEANRSRTANETRQADAAATLQAFFRMAVCRRHYQRHRLTLTKQLRAIDKLRCCRAAVLLSRFCRGHLVRRDYRALRAAVAARRQDNLLRRTKAAGGGGGGGGGPKDGLPRAPGTHLVPGQCSPEEWTLDVLARYNVNFVHGVRAMCAGEALDAIGFFDTHIRTSTLSSKEQAHESLAETLMAACTGQLAPAQLAELQARQSKTRRRY